MACLTARATAPNEALMGALNGGAHCGAANTGEVGTRFTFAPDRQHRSAGQARLFASPLSPTISSRFPDYGSSFRTTRGRHAPARRRRPRAARRSRTASRSRSRACAPRQAAGLAERRRRAQTPSGRAIVLSTIPCVRSGPGGEPRSPATTGLDFPLGTMLIGL